MAQKYTTLFGSRDAPIFPNVPKTYDINLDLDYHGRYQEVLADFEGTLSTFVNGLGLEDNVPYHVLDLINYPIMSAYNKEFAEEMKAISDLTKLSFKEVTFLNFIYDITTQCTSLIVQDADNNIIHGRNLDFPYASELAKLIFHGRYFRNGELVYEAASLVGYAGVITAVKPGAYSLSIDQYILLDNPSIWHRIETRIIDMVQMFRGKLDPILVARHAFETIPDYDGLIEYLKETDTLSRLFYIVAGTQPGQGTVITKFRNSVENVTTLDAEAGRWYLVQTNYNGKVDDPKDDNRRTAAEDWLDIIGREEITKQNLLDEVMTVYPVFNNETIHTSIMQASTGYFNTTLWNW